MKTTIINSIGVMNLSAEFLAIERELLNRLKEYGFSENQYKDKRLWARCEYLKQMRSRKIKTLLANNRTDNMHDAIHDAILCADDNNSYMPDGYKAIIIASYYSTIIKCYHTIAMVTTPNNCNYFMDVATYNKLESGMILQ